MPKPINGIGNMLEIFGDEIEDAEEESFLLFSQDLPSQNLGFVDSKATCVNVSVAGRDYSIHQSPTLLSSDRVGGTTGAVIWKITPLFAEWIADRDNILFDNNILDAGSTVLELGCGISGIIGLTLASKVKRYVATDQEYVFKLLKQNLAENQPKVTSRVHAKNVATRDGRSRRERSFGNIEMLALDWEASIVTELPQMLQEIPVQAVTINAIIACDCIYSHALISPLVETCAGICRLPSVDPQKIPTVCIIAQQLRSYEVLEAWLSKFMTRFRVWRVPDKLLNKKLRGNSGFVIHLGILKEQRGATVI